jgi:hypothetical protein
MRVSVGKPTLRLDEPNAFPKLIHVNFLTWLEVGNRFGEPESMTRSNHCRDPLLALAGIDGLCREWPDPSPLREAKCRLDRFLVCVSRRVGPVVFLDTRMPQLVGKPPLAVTASRKRPGLGQRISGVIDQAEFGEPIGKLLEARCLISRPAALADLLREILAKLCPGRRIFADIAKCEFPQALIVEWYRCAAASGLWLHA